MTEEEKEEEEFTFKLNAFVVYIDGNTEEFKNIDVIRDNDKCMVLLKDLIDGTNFFRTSIKIPYENIMKIKTDLIEIE